MASRLIRREMGVDSKFLKDNMFLNMMPADLPFEEGLNLIRNGLYYAEMKVVEICREIPL